MADENNSVDLFAGDDDDSDNSADDIIDDEMFNLDRNIGDSDIDFNDDSDDESDGSESESNDLDFVDNVPTWSDHLTDVYVRRFIRQAGPLNTLDETATELDYFNLYFPTPLIGKIVEETNRFAAQQQLTRTDHLWKETTFAEMRAFIDAPTNVPAWPRPLLPQGTSTRVTPKPLARKDLEVDTAVSSGKNITVSTAESGLIYDCLKTAAEQLIASESKLNDLDKQCGDGDCGSTMARGAHAILSQLGSKENPGVPVSCPGDLALTLANIAEDLMGGSSGGLYSLFFTAAAQCLQQSSQSDAWCQALSYGIQTMMKYGGAEPGDRTMLDALHAGCTTLTTELQNKSSVEAYALAVQAAEKAAEATASMKAKAGRASYVSADHLTNPDPGAVAVCVWMKAILQVISA